MEKSGLRENPWLQSYLRFL